MNENTVLDEVTTELGSFSLVRFARGGEQALALTFSFSADFAPAGDKKYLHFFQGHPFKEPLLLGRWSGEEPGHQAEALARATLRWLAPSLRFLCTRERVDDSLKKGGATLITLPHGKTLLRLFAVPLSSSSVADASAMEKALGAMASEGREEPGDVDAARLLLALAGARGDAENFVKIFSKEPTSTLEAAARMAPQRASWGLEVFAFTRDDAKFDHALWSNEKSRRVALAYFALRAEDNHVAPLDTLRARGGRWGDFSKESLKRLWSVPLGEVPWQEILAPHVHGPLQFEMANAAAGALPLAGQVFLDFLLGCTVEEYVFLRNARCIDRDVPISLREPMARDALAMRSWDARELLVRFGEAYHVFHSAALRHGARGGGEDISDLLVRTYSFGMSYGERYPGAVQLLTGCLEECPRDGAEAMAEVALGVMRVAEGSHMWLSRTDSADYVLRRFLAVSTPRHALHTLHGATSLGKPITLAQWAKYFDNFDEYKDMPVEWWLPLL